MPLIRYVLILLIWPTLSFAQNNEWYCTDSNDVHYIDTALGKQKIMIFEPDGEANELIFFFHGDSASRPPSYQYDMARRIVGHREGAVAVAVLRPGYEDGCGDRSKGDAGFKMGDNYTLEVVNALAEVISTVQSEYPLETTLFGHSGGAALSAILMNRHPDLANTALLAACPCDLPAWRQHMYERTGNERWKSDLSGVSPMDETDNLKAGTELTLVVAEKDPITPLSLSQNFNTKVISRRVVATGVMELHGDDHDAIINDEVLKIVLEITKPKTIRDYLNSN